MARARAPCLLEDDTYPAKSGTNPAEPGTNPAQDVTAGFSVSEWDQNGPISGPGRTWLSQAGPGRARGRGGEGRGGV